MATERIKLTKNSFITKDRLGNTTFNSDNYYLKPDPAGSFKVGGYNRCPVVIGWAGQGYNTTGDSAYRGGYPLYSTGINDFASGTRTLYTFSFAIPRFHTINIATYGMSGGIPRQFFISNALPVYLNGVLLTYVRFRAVTLAQPTQPNVIFGTGGTFVADYGEGFAGYHSAPANFSLVNSASATPYNSGTIVVNLDSVAYRTLTTQGVYLTGYSSYKNYIGFTVGGANWFSLENPSTLSLAVTP